VAGYSGTPLGKKLGIKEGSAIFPINAPRNYRALIGPLPPGARIVSRLSEATDIVHVFSTSRKAIDEALRTSLARLKPDGVIWVSWPKKAAKVPTDVTEDTIREIALPMGLVDVKVCAVDDVWSGLKLVIRKENRVRKGSGPS
jgi:hypothetical protein